MALLDVRALKVRFGSAAVVDGLDFRVERGECLAIVGESGCGKSMTALALTRLLARPGRIEGEVRLDGTDLVALSERRMRAVRGAGIGIVFQDSMSALNPVRTVGDQIAEAIRAHARVGAGEARRRVRELLDLVHIPDAARRIDDYPHRFSGGMRQRVAIAMAIAARPAVLIADEPTTALDVTIQAQILALLADLQRELGMALLLITHDLGVVSEVADRVLVMYAGRKVEEQATADLFARPLHPYTRRLMAAKPRLDIGPAAALAVGRLEEIPGLVPLPDALPPGCRFGPRCWLAAPACSDREPELEERGDALVACHRADDALDEAFPALPALRAAAGGRRSAP